VLSPSQIEIAKAADLLCALAPERIHLQLSAFVAALFPNLSHQRAPVRQCTAVAVGSLLLHGAEGLERIMRDVALDALRALGFDRTASVRQVTRTRCLSLLVAACLASCTTDAHALPPAFAQEMCRVVAKLLVRLPVRESFEPALFTLLLGRIADEQEAVRVLALRELISATEAIAAASDASAMVCDDGSGSGAGAGSGGVTPGLPHPFDRTAVPAVTAAAVERLLPRILHSVLRDMEDWKQMVRLCACGALRSTLAIVQVWRIAVALCYRSLSYSRRPVLFSTGHTVMSPHVHILFPPTPHQLRASVTRMLPCASVQRSVVAEVKPICASLCRGSRDEDADVRSLVTECASLVGRFVAPDVLLSVLLPQVRGEVSGLAGADHRAASIAILAGVVSGTSAELLLPCLPAVAAALAAPM
jgi:hypothetical protein